MAIDITEPNTLDIAQARELVEQLVLELHPSLDTRGAVGDLLLGSYALLGAGYAKDAERLRASRSLKALEANPEAATTEVVDAVLSNFNLTRLSPQPATGEIEFVLGSNYVFTIPAGALFTIRGQVFTTTETYTARLTNDNVITGWDLPITPVSNGRYSVRFPVEAQEAGRSDPIRRGDTVIPDFEPQSLLLARAATDFLPGRGVETNAELLRRLRSGMALKAWSTSGTIEALLLNSEDEIGQLHGVSVIGLQDPELQRTRHPVTQVVSGGCDVYVREGELPRHQVLVLEAVKEQNQGTGSIRVLNIDSATAPGFYEVLSITRSQDDTPLQILSEMRGVNETQYGTPAFLSALDAAFGPYQTGTIRFLDPETTAQTQLYTVTVSLVPGLGTIQDFLGSPLHRPLGGDVHVRAAIPCFTSVELVIEVQGQSVLVNEESVQSAVSREVNSRAFPNRVYRSRLEAAAAPHLPDLARIRSSAMRGRIKLPSGAERTVLATDVLSVPTDLPNYLSPKTVAFYCYPQDVVLQILSVS